MEVDLWGQPVRHTAQYHVFHDESIPNKRCLLIGFVFVETGHLQKARAVLESIRNQESYHGEIHFSGLPGRFNGAWGAKTRVARKWTQAFPSSLCDYVSFSVLAVDRQSPWYEHKRFSKGFHAYNRFTAMALKAGIAWHLGPRNLDQVFVHFISDTKNRASRPDRAWIDNFEQYLPYRAELDAFIGQSQGRRYPFVTTDY